MPGASLTAVLVAALATGAVAEPDSGMTLKAGQDGTALRSLTVEGEDRVQIQFERPPLQLELDPSQAPGLEWGSPQDVLQRAAPDALSPLLSSVTRESCPYLGRPWLFALERGAVARFQPRVEGVDRWKLIVGDSRGATVAEFSGKGKPPSELSWNGARSDGTPALPGLTYSYAFEAYDRAGNKRTFVGDGFGLPAYSFAGPKGKLLLLPGDQLLGAPRSSPAGTVGAGAEPPPPLVLEAASCINQSGVAGKVTVTALARDFDSARALGDAMAAGLAANLLGDPARVQVLTEVQRDAPAQGVVQVAY